MHPRPFETTDAYLFEKIYLATAMLQMHSRGSSTVAEQKVSSPLDIMQHIATLLTTGNADGTPGDGKDVKVNRGVAVTGHASADRIEALVLVTRSTSSSSTDPTLANPVMVDISNEDADFALKVVEQWGDETPQPSFEEYSKNVFAMLNIFRVSENAPARDFLRYVIRHCYPKMVFRMQLASVVWEEPPLTVIENYFKGDYSFNPRKPFPWRLRIRKADSFMVDRLKICHPELDARTAIYEVNANNVADWVNKLVVTYDNLTRYLAERTERGALKPKKALERKFADAALLAMLSLDAVMIRMGFLEHLLSDSRLADQLARTSVTFSARSDEDEDGQLEEDEDVIDRDAGKVADLLLQRGEDTAHHVVRFYKSILAWVTAVRYATGFKLPHPLRPYILTMSSPDIPKARVDSAKTSLFESVLEKIHHSKRALAEKWLMDRDSTCFRSSEHGGMPALHAEASLMALYHYFKDPGATIDSATRTWGLTPAQCRVLFRVFSTRSAVIGVGKKCCWCCWRLRTLINAKNGASGDEVVMLGSHATIYPWYPPQAGVPVDILQQFNRELEEILVDAAEKNLQVKRRNSTQSSARSSGDSPPSANWRYNPERDDSLE